MSCGCYVYGRGKNDSMPSVKEQSVTTREIAENVAQASQGISEVNENVAQSATVSEEIAKDIGALRASC